MSAFSALFDGGIGAALTGVGSILSPVLSMFGQQEANKQNIRLARENREFQERMANTEVQRRAEDLSAAGFNRLLAVGNGASSPSGSVAHVDNTMESFKNNPLNILALQRARADIDKTKAETAVQSVLAQNQAKEGLLKDLALSYGLINQEYRKLELSRLKNMTPYDLAILKHREAESRHWAGLAETKGELMYQNFRGKELENQILRLAMPGLENTFNVENSLYGQGLEYVRQTLGAIGSLLGPAAHYFRPTPSRR